MCFFGANNLRAQAVPTGDSEEARRRILQQQQLNEQQQGRRATILTSPLGDPKAGSNITRTTLTGLNA